MLSESLDRRKNSGLSEIITGIRQYSIDIKNFYNLSAATEQISYTAPGFRRIAGRRGRRIPSAKPAGVRL